MSTSEEIIFTTLGECRSGKTSILMSYLDIEIDEYEPTIEDEETIKILNNPVHVIDTSGNQEEINKNMCGWIQRSTSFLIVIDLSDTKALTILNKYKDYILKYKETLKVPIVIVGNKLDIKKTFIYKHEIKE
jgi:Ras-related protein Rap-1B